MKKISDFIVEFFLDKGVNCYFGYPGGMVTHLMDSIDKYRDSVKSILNYHEQAASFSVSGYGQVALKPAVCYATSGPGGTNMITGICNAYYDSIPSIFISGQVNTYESAEGMKIRQLGFQETDIVNMVKSVTNYATRITLKDEIKYELEKAYHYATVGRSGPVLLDIPMDIQRSEVDIHSLKSFSENIFNINETDYSKIIYEELKKAKRPVIIVGAGVRLSSNIAQFRQLVEKLKIPIVSSMIAVDSLESDCIYNFGFIGAYGMRHANILVAKADLVISLGSRLDVRQTGANLSNFAPNAKLIRIDIDKDELTRKIKADEIGIVEKLSNIIQPLLQYDFQEYDRSEWLNSALKIKDILSSHDRYYINDLLKEISRYADDDGVIITDVGQNMVWVAQSFNVKQNQRVLFSGGHGAMGYSLPASIGAAIASGKKVYSFNGDGGFQMNIQELQTVANSKLPIKIIILNNRSLGMIRHFQELYFNSNYVLTKNNTGYSVPNFSAISKAYALEYHSVRDINDISAKLFAGESPAVVEIFLDEDSYLFPKLVVGLPAYDQEPPLDRELLKKILEI